MMLGGPGKRCVVLMNQSSRDYTLLDVRPSPGPGRGAVSHQSSRDKRTKRSLPGSTVRREGRAISALPPVSRRHITRWDVGVMIDLNDEALALAAKELGTTTKKDTVNAALAFVADRRRRIEQLLNDPYALGVGPDITDPEVMRQARR